MTPKRGTEMRHSLFWGLALIIVGSLFLVDRLGLVEIDNVWNFWPAFIALHGALAVMFANNLAQAIDGVFSIVVGFWIYACLEHLWGWTFIATWPVIVIAAGVVMVSRGLLNTSKGANGENAQ
ncbi:MAG: DUF5668 domain-containing protein [Betaproteobacteria bacterium]